MSETDNIDLKKIAANFDEPLLSWMLQDESTKGFPKSVILEQKLGTKPAVSFDTTYVSVGVSGNDRGKITIETGYGPHQITGLSLKHQDELVKAARKFAEAEINSPKTVDEARKQLMQTAKEAFNDPGAKISR